MATKKKSLIDQAKEAVDHVLHPNAEAEVESESEAQVESIEESTEVVADAMKPTEEGVVETLGICADEPHDLKLEKENATNRKA